MASELDRKASTVVGGMSLRVEKTGRAPEEAGGSRMQFLYEVRAGEHVYRGTDLYAGVGMDVSASRMVETRCATISTPASAVSPSRAARRRASVTTSRAENESSKM